MENVSAWMFLLIGRQRQNAEEELVIQKEILAERKKELSARMELAEVKKKTIFDA